MARQLTHPIHGLAAVSALYDPTALLALQALPREPRRP
jgi:hypothetical protein